MTDHENRAAAPAGGAAEPPPSGPRSLLSLTRPTWELELLISGAVIFSLFQLPGLLADVYFGVERHLSADLVMVPTLLYYGAMLCVIVLMAGFVVHFLARAFWVALCGLNTVFPEGVVWDRLDVGPLQREYYQRHTPSAATLERRADRFASTIFPLLFYMLISAGVVCGYMALGVVLLGGLLRWAIPTLPQVAVLYGVLLLYLGPVLVLGALDAYYKKRPERLEARPRWRRRLVRLFGLWYRWAALQPLYGAIPLTFQTHFSTKKATWAFFAAGLVLALAFAAVFTLQVGVLGYDSYHFLPERGHPRVVQTDHYEALRPPGSRARVPTIQSDVIAGRYVRLFVPYRPSSDRKLVEAACPGLEPLREEGVFVRPLLDRRVDALDREALDPTLECLAKIWRVSLDGGPLRPEWDFYRHPDRGTAGLVAHLPAAGLAPGRHELVVEKGPAAAEAAGEAAREEREEEDEARRYTIPFWL